MLSSADRPLSAVVLERGTVLRPPAPQRAVEVAAARLGLVFPPSYVAFLAVSDGAFANGCGPVTRSGEYGLLPAADVCRLVDVAADHVALWVESLGGVELEGREARADGQDVRSFAPFGEAVLITPMIDAICDCLVAVAPEFDAGGEGFEVWGTFKEGATRYLTFGRWLEQMVVTQWVARDDDLVRRLLPEVGEHLAAIGRWAADPGYHWFAVRQVRRLAAAPGGDRRVTEALDRLWAGDDAYLRLAAAQADLGHRRDRAMERLASLARSGAIKRSEPTLALAAEATLRVCDHPALRSPDIDAR